MSELCPIAQHRECWKSFCLPWEITASQRGDIKGRLSRFEVAQEQFWPFLAAMGLKVAAGKQRVSRALSSPSLLRVQGTPHIKSPKRLAKGILELSESQSLDQQQDQRLPLQEQGA